MECGLDSFQKSVFLKIFKFEFFGGEDKPGAVLMLKTEEFEEHIYKRQTQLTITSEYQVRQSMCMPV